MATYIKGQSISLVAAADLSTSQFRAIKVDGNGRAALAALGEFAIGVLQNNPGANVPASVMVSGTSKGVAGAAITAGDRLAVDAAGRFIPATAGRTNTSDAGVAADALIGSHVVGIALTSAVLNDVFTLLIAHAGAVPTTLA